MGQLQQELKVKPGSITVITQTLMGVPDLAIDDDARKISFNIGNVRPLPEGPITIGTGGSINSDMLEEAVERYAKSLLTKSSTFESQYPAIDKFLLMKLNTS